MSIEDFSAWIGRSETVTDVLDPARSNALRAALGDATPLAAGDVMPILHHWLYFWNVAPPAGLGVDGHPAKGGFLPPVPLPRRMWAGGALTFHGDLLLGETVTKVSTIDKVEAKSGKSGNLVFVTVRHELSGANGLAVSERQDIVYKEASATGPALPDAAAPAPEASWRREVYPDAVLLFRYSALTMNGHRIHYDRPYAMGEEAYPALVVHGPLQATMLAHTALRNLGKPLKSFTFRGAVPAFDGLPLFVCGEPTEDGASVWTQQGGVKNMTATAVA
ncbi:MAG: MaoC family dehydratase N-terminal domain-containing protein [Sphingomonadales bacterium]|nr:MaoC family dehydratase N-terminal domain-containing protein [Sphingomonadales bacterium]